MNDKLGSVTKHVLLFILKICFDLTHLTATDDGEHGDHGDLNLKFEY